MVNQHLNIMKNLLIHDNSLKTSLKFMLQSRENALNLINNDEDQDIYIILIHTVNNLSRKFQPINLIYLLDIINLNIIDISVSDLRFRSNNIKGMLLRSKIPKAAFVLTPNCTPFTTQETDEFFKEQRLNHKYYEDHNLNPLVELTKTYLHTMILTSIMMNKHIHYDKIKEFAQD
jgi:hypothetical protein